MEWARILERVFEGMGEGVTHREEMPSAVHEKGAPQEEGRKWKGKKWE